MKRLPSPIYRLVLLALLAGGTHAWSQSTNGAMGSDPNPNSYLPARSPDSLLQQKKFVDQYAAPPSLVPTEPSDQPQLPPPDQVSPQEVERQKKQTEKDQNWMLMTPEEIMGVDDQKKKDDPYNLDADLTPEQRFVKRDEQSRIITNAISSHVTTLDDEYWSRKEELKKNHGSRQTDDFDEQLRAANGAFQKFRNPFTDLTTGRGESPDAAGNSALGQAGPQSPWATSLWSSSPNNTDDNQADTARLEDMKRFHEMLNPSVSDTAKTPHSTVSDSLFAPQTSTDPFGAGYAPLKDNIGRPAPLPTLVPLPGAKPYYTPRQPSPPPWVSNPTQNNPPPIF